MEGDKTMGDVRLNPNQRRILERLAREPGEGHMTPSWISEACGHFYRPEWANVRLKALAERGLVESVCRGWWVITDAGRAAIGSLGANPHPTREERT
jgi:hypothetical protein